MLSNTAYCQDALCEKLARDLDLDLAELKAALPRRRTTSTHLWDPTGDRHPGPDPVGERNSTYTRVIRSRYGMGNTDEEVR